MRRYREKRRQNPVAKHGLTAGLGAQLDNGEKIINLVALFILLEDAQRKYNINGQQRHTYHLNYKSPPGHKYKNYDHSTEGEHRTTEQFAWRSQKSLGKWTLIAAVFAAMSGGGSLVFTAIEADIARETLKSSNRPWLSVAISDFGDISRQPDGTLQIGLALKAYNFGLSPALTVRQMSEMIPTGDKDANMNIIGEESKICYSGKSTRVWGQVVFQGTESAILAFPHTLRHPETLSPVNHKYASFFIIVCLAYTYGSRTGHVAIQAVIFPKDGKNFSSDAAIIPKNSISFLDARILQEYAD